LILNQLQNKILLLLREQGWNPNPMLAPTYPAAGEYNSTVMTADLNLAQQTFMADVGFRTMLTERYNVLLVSPGLDFALPADCYALMRLEYQSGFFGAVVLEAKTFDEFDALTAGGYSNTDVGYPEVYRTPYGPAGAQVIRFWPQPTAGNVTAGDTIGLYYSSTGTPMVTGTDSPGIPAPLHEALACWVLSRYWRRKNDSEQATMYLKDYAQHVHNGKALAENLTQESQASIEDVETVGAGNPLSGVP
jgi:hypothetical protein